MLISANVHLCMCGSLCLIACVRMHIMCSHAIVFSVRAYARVCAYARMMRACVSGFVCRHVLLMFACTCGNGVYDHVRVYVYACQACVYVCAHTCVRAFCSFDCYCCCCCCYCVFVYVFFCSTVRRRYAATRGH